MGKRRISIVMIVSLLLVFFASSACPKIGSKEHVNMIKTMANSGNATSMITLAIYYLRGFHGLPKDTSRGMMWLTRAANLNDLDAMEELWKTYYFGRYGVVKDEAKAMHWVGKMATQGDPEAMGVYGAYLVGSKNIDEKNEGLKYLVRSERAGDKTSPRTLAILAVNKQIVLPPSESYETLLLRSYKRGNSSALIDLCMIYDQVKKNRYRAVACYAFARKNLPDTYQKDIDKHDAACRKNIGKVDRGKLRKETNLFTNALSVNEIKLIK